MPIHIRFKAGGRQAFQAGHYFQEEANALLNSVLAASVPRNYLVAPGNGPSVPLRLWTGLVLPDEALTALAHEVRRVEEDAWQVAHAKHGAEALEHAYHRWQQVAWPCATFFLERLDPHAPFTPNEGTRTNIAVIDRELVLISAPRFIHCRLHPGLYGIAVALRGSYLLEQVDAAPAVHAPSTHPW